MRKISLYTLLLAALVLSCNKSEPIIDDGGDGEENTGGGGNEGGNGDGDKVVFDLVTVLEYSPAPGQFINEGHVPLDAADAAAWAQGRIGDNLFVSLGAFGGYIVVKPSRSITNVEGYDFGISGNPITTHNEPGIVWVSSDLDGDGVPDKWYQLKGSDEGQHGYTVTYYRTDEPGDVRWTDAKGEGVVKHLPGFHDQNYYPSWCDENGTITLTGTLLQPNYSYVNNQERNSAYGWGYADNLGSDALYDDKNRYVCNRFDISDAVDENGNAVDLTRVDFIMVQSSLLFNMGITGELSTEVSGFVLLDKQK